MHVLIAIEFCSSYLFLKFIFPSLSFSLSAPNALFLLTIGHSSSEVHVIIGIVPYLLSNNEDCCSGRWCSVYLQNFLGYFLMVVLPSHFCSFSLQFFHTYHKIFKTAFQRRQCNSEKGHFF